MEIKMDKYLKKKREIWNKKMMMRMRMMRMKQMI